MYQPSERAAKTSACATIVGQVDASQFDAAEEGINQLLAALYNDFANCIPDDVFLPISAGSCVLTGGAGVSKSAVADFGQAVCSLGTDFLPTTGNEVDCAAPSVDNLANPDALPTETNQFSSPALAGGWIVVPGVVADPTLDAVSSRVTLPNGEFAIQIDALDPGITSVYVTIREDNPTPTTGSCPSNSDYDCEKANYVIDMDNPNDPIGAIGEFGGLYVEMCNEIFGAPTIGHCTGAGVCEPETETRDRNYLDCSSSIKGFSPSRWVGQDEDLAARDVIAIVTSNSAAISLGTTCQAIEKASGDPKQSCLTDEIEGKKSAKCTLFDVPAADDDEDTDPGAPVAYTLFCEKNPGTGSHTGSEDFVLSQSNPILGESLPVEVRVAPQR